MPSVSERQIIQAIRQRMLEDIQRKQEAASIVNNVYGQGAIGEPERAPSGLSQQMGTPAEMDPDLYDYMVQIERRDLPDINPATGKPAGWQKSVTRSRIPKGSAPIGGEPLTPSQMRKLKKKQELEKKKLK